MFFMPDGMIGDALPAAIGPDLDGSMEQCLAQTVQAQRNSLIWQLLMVLQLVRLLRKARCCCIDTAGHAISQIVR